MYSICISIPFNYRGFQKSNKIYSEYIPLFIYLCGFTTLLNFNMRNFYTFLFSILVFTVSGQVDVTISAIQGGGNSSPYNGQNVKTTGIVTAVFVGSGTINGFFMQDKTGDGNPSTSDGIFVYSPNNTTIEKGDEISITASVSEYFNKTQLSNSSNITVLSKGNTIQPQKIIYDINNWNWESYEGMLVEFQQPLYVNNNYYLEQRGELELGVRRKPVPTNIALPLSSEYAALVSENSLPPIILDDAFTATYVSPIVFADEYGTRRLGEKVDKLQAVVDYANSKFVFYPADEVRFFGNPRNRMHDDIGNYNLKVCGFNLEFYLVQNYGGGYGAANLDELNRQHAKIVDALYAIDADVYGLVEIEQGQVALTKLVQALNAKSATNNYTFINDGGTSTSSFTKAAYLYRSDKVSPVGNLTNINTIVSNRKKIQGFELKSNKEKFMFSINHFKAKSGCNNAGGKDADQDDGQSCYNYSRVQEANAVINAINAGKASYGTENVLIMGDLNAYAKEDPIQAFVNKGYVDLQQKFHADSAYSYVYRTETGYLDHAIANESMAQQITGVTAFHINADELGVFGYDGAKWDVGMFRSSDHDPIIVGIALGQSSNGNISDSSLNVYPTVVTDLLNIEVTDRSVVQIYSVSGIKLFEKEIESREISLNSAGILPGAYILRVLYDGKIHQQIIFVK